MSYCRWSTYIENDLSLKEYIEIYKTGGYESWKVYAEERGWTKSDWYIFWHCAECIAIYHVVGDDAPCFSYDEVVEMYENKNYQEWFNYEITQLDYLDDVLRRVVEDMKEEQVI